MWRVTLLIPVLHHKNFPKALDTIKYLKNFPESTAFQKQISKLKKPYKPHEGKKTDEAHPSIHPTGVLPEKLGKDDRKLYELIVFRFISVFGEDAIIETMKTDFKHWKRGV